MVMDVKEVTEQVQKESSSIKALQAEIARVIVGQHYLVERLLIALLADGHVLLEGVGGGFTWGAVLLKW